MSLAVTPASGLVWKHQSVSGTDPCPARRICRPQGEGSLPVVSSPRRNSAISSPFQATKGCKAMAFNAPYTHPLLKPQSPADMAVCGPRHSQGPYCDCRCPQDPSIQEWGTEAEDDGDPPRLWAQNGSHPGTAFTRSLGDSGALQKGEPQDLSGWHMSGRLAGRPVAHCCLTDCLSSCSLLLLCFQPQKTPLRCPPPHLAAKVAAALHLCPSQRPE